MQNNRRTDEEIINDIIEAFKNVLKTRLISQMNDYSFLNRWLCVMPSVTCGWKLVG